MVEPPEGHHGGQSVRGGEGAGVGYGPRVQVGGKKDASCPCATTTTAKNRARADLTVLRARGLISPGGA